MYKLIISLVFLALNMGACSLSDSIHSDFEARQSETNDDALFSIFDSTMTTEERAAMEFLYAYMPLPDMVDYDGNFYLQNVRTSLQARAELPWGKTVQEQEFKHFVLPIRVNNENMDAFRWTYYEELRDRVRNLSMEDAILEVNHWCHEHVTYTPSDERTSAPMATIKTAYGRCGEESTLLVAALRTVGIPARQVYTPRWAHTDNNHAWVEAWANGKWYFLGACEPEPVLNLGWFNAPASRGMLMHTKVFGNYQGPEEVMSKNACFTEINVTRNYAPVAKALVHVTDSTGNDLEGASVEFKIYNYAEFFTVCEKVSDKNGMVSLEAGLGDLVVWGRKDDCFGVARCHVAEGDTTQLCLCLNEKSQASIDFEIVPPKEQNTLPEVSDEQRKENDRRMAYEDSIRNAYEATFNDSTPLLKFSRGNHETIKAFLDNTKDTILLRTLSGKDLHDVTMDVLMDHHNNMPQKAKYLTDEMYNRFVRRPRIANEQLSPYRQFFLNAISNAISDSLQSKWQQQPLDLVEWVADSITVDTIWNPQSLRMQPIGSWKCRKTDADSRDILFVALARTCGIPARIDRITGKVQYMDSQNEWQDAIFNKEAVKDTSATSTTAFLKAVYTPQPWLDDPEYNTHFTLAILKDGKAQTLGYGGTYNRLLKNGIKVDAGTYALISGMRLASGSVLAHMTLAQALPGDTTTTDLILRQPTDEPKVIGGFNSNLLLSTTGRGQFAVAIIQPNHEPTNHALRDISARRADIEAWGRPLVILFRSEAEAARFNKSEFPGLPKNTIWDVDKNGSVERDIRHQMHVSDGAPLPLVFIADTFDHVLFFSQGYTIGLGDQLMKAVQQLSAEKK